MPKDHDKISHRLALILIKLNSGDRFTVGDLSKEFNVSTRTIQRDLKRLQYLPIKSENGVYSLEEYCLGRLNFDDIRGFATLCGIKDLYPSLKDDFLVDLLNSKINQTYLVRGFNYEDLSSKTKEFQIVNVAILTNKKLKFEYKAKRRVVNPYKLINNNGSWYLVADDGGVLKNFTFTKISKLLPLDENFEPNDDFLKIIEENQITWFSKTIIEVLLEVDMEVANYFERKRILPSQKIVEKLENAIIVSTKVSFEDEILRIVRYWIPHIKIISPKNLQEKLENGLRNYLERHNLS